MPQYTRQENRLAQQRFRDAPGFDSIKYDFEHWINRHEKSFEIVGMSEAQLRRAISYLDRGFTCFGQRAKIITLRRVLANKTGA